MYDSGARCSWEFKLDKKSKQITINTEVMHDSRVGQRRD